MVTVVSSVFGITFIIQELCPLHFIASKCSMMPGNSCIFKIIFIRVQLIYNVVLVSGVQHGDSVIRIHVSILFPYRPLQSIE